MNKGTDTRDTSSVLGKHLYTDALKSQVNKMNKMMDDMKKMGIKPPF
jgi:hypothetical protein